MITARGLGLWAEGANALRPGPLNALTDVAGVAVGHCTLTGPGLATGVTSILPHPGDPFRHKLRAGVEVINGFGKSGGLTQLAELGLLETPILLTNTFGVAPCTEALIRRAIAANPAIGRATSTVNPVVFECNDGAISDIQALAVGVPDAFAALDAARPGPFAQGAVGAGAGMTAFGFKAGIGSASRLMPVAEGQTFTLGALVLANFGRAGDLVLPDGRRPDPRSVSAPERGSVIVVLATDLPLDQRQLQRVARRAGAGLARLGAFWGHGSGDIALAFTTADPVPHQAPLFQTLRRLEDDLIDLPFRAAAEATQEAVLNALAAAPATMGRDGRFFPALADWAKEATR